MPTSKRIILMILIGCTISHGAYSSEEINVTIENSTGKIAKRTLQGKENTIIGDFPESVVEIQQTHLTLPLNGQSKSGIGAIYQIEDATNGAAPEAGCVFGVAFDKEGNIQELVAKHFFAARCDANSIDDHSVLFNIRVK